MPYLDCHQIGKKALRLMKNKYLLLLGWFERGAILRSARNSNTPNYKNVKTGELGKTVRTKFFPHPVLVLVFLLFCVNLRPQTPILGVSFAYLSHFHANVRRFALILRYVSLLLIFPWQILRLC